MAIYTHTPYAHIHRDYLLKHAHTFNNLKQTHEIAIKKKDVMTDLDKVEPAVIEASRPSKASGNNI